MNMPREFLGLALKLAEAGESDQASLRRSVSTSYYALFHFLVDEATKRMFGAEDERAILRSWLARKFEHGAMKKAAQAFASGASRRGSHGKFLGVLNGRPVQPEIVHIAETFVQVQSARHDADYNMSKTFDKRSVLNLAHKVERSFENWPKIRNSIQADVFLAGLFAYRNIRTN